MNLVVVAQPTSEPVSLTQAKNFLRVSITDDDVLIGTLISAAREAVETFTGRSIATKQYRQGFDAPPYFVDSVVSQMAYPPAYYSLPMYSTAMWNYSQQIKLFAPPLISVDEIEYTDLATGNDLILDPSKYIVDSDSEPARLFPGPAGTYWPSCLFVPNAFRVTFTAGYDTDPSSAGVPADIQLAILMLVNQWYENRGDITSEIPKNIQMLLWSKRVMDMQPTRG